MDGVGPATEEINDLKIQSDGKIVASLWVENVTATMCGLVRYTVNGTLDPSFGSGGKVISNVGGGNQSFEGVAIQTDGRIVSVGFASGAIRQYVVARYNSYGSQDASFGMNGLVKGSFGTSTTDNLQAVAIQADGIILAVGNTRQTSVAQFVVARFLMNGSPDGSFGTGGFMSFGFTNSGASAEAVQIRPVA